MNSIPKIQEWWVVEWNWETWSVEVRRVMDVLAENWNAMKEGRKKGSLVLALLAKLEQANQYAGDVRRVLKEAGDRGRSQESGVRSQKEEDGGGESSQGTGGRGKGEEEKTGACLTAMGIALVTARSNVKVAVANGDKVEEARARRAVDELERGVKILWGSEGQGEVRT